MKRALLVLSLALMGGFARAQDDHQGPVVYPATNAAPADAASSASTPSTDMSVQATPTTPDGNPPAAPAASASPAGGNPAVNPVQGLAPAAAGGKQDDIYDIRPPYFYLKPLTWLWVLLGALGVIALCVALWFLVKPLRAFRAKTPYEVALEKLEKARAMLNEENPEPYAVYVSETIRTYLGQRYRILSTRRTTEEFLRQVQADPATPLAPHRDLLREFLESCDLVKFAHYQPGREELEQVQQRAVSFVTATRPPEGATA
jgi:hypothetical protein